MGLLDQIMGGGQPQRRAGMGQTVAAGVILALLVKAIRSHQQNGAAAAQGRSFDPAAPGGQAPGMGGGGLGGMLGGMLGGGAGGGGLGGLGGLLSGGGLGGILGGLGGAGALGSVIGRMQQNGFGQQVSSWVSPGANQPIEPHQLSQALGDDVVEDLQQQTGMPRDQLLSELSHALPEAINEATPHGREPTDDELHQIAQGGTPGAS